jgi:hypothetical protein
LDPNANASVEIVLREGQTEQPPGGEGGGSLRSHLAAEAGHGAGDGKGVEGHEGGEDWELVDADPTRSPCPSSSPTAAGAAIDLLPVYEDLDGDSTEEGAHPPTYLPPAADGPRLGVGGIGDGITNPGRLLGLGMALGIGVQVLDPAAGLGFGGVAGAGDGDADLSALHRRPSKSEMKRQARRAGRPATTQPHHHYPRQQEDFVGAGSGRKNSRKGTGKKGFQAPAPAAAFETLEAGEEEYGRGRGGFAGFEQHTTGIGSRLLSKWGFAGQGSGLGREGEGRAEPIQVRKRSKGLGLGAD